MDGITGKEYSAKQILSDATHLAILLRQSFNLKAGDKISVCSENRYEFAITIHAAHFLGVTIAPINNSYTECK